MAHKAETIREFTDSRGLNLSVDAESGVIRGVKLLGYESANGRVYPKETVARAVNLYEGAKVNVDHPSQRPDAPRNYGDRIGVIRNVRVEQGDGGLRGDFHANPKHQLFEQLSWDAQHAPQSVGFSHNIQGRTSRRDGKTVVEEITRVQSVDLVADPATTRGLFEDTGDHPSEKEEDDVTVKELTSAVLEVENPRLVEEIRVKALTEHANSQEARAKEVRLSELEKENDDFKFAAKVREQEEDIDKLLAEAKLPEAAITPVFRNSLLEAKDDDAVKALIEDRAALAKLTAGNKPRSKEQTTVTEGEQDMSADEFLKRLTKPERGAVSHV